MERFIKEYANYQKKQIENNILMQEEKKMEALKSIEKAVNAREKGLITVDETMHIIANCLW